MNEFYRKYRLPLVIAFLYWILITALRVDNHFMEYDVVGSFMWGVKLLCLGLLMVFACFVTAVIRHVRSGDRIYRRGLMFFSVYFLFMLILTLIKWPGNWMWDDIHSLEQIRIYDFKPWQELITVIYQIILLQMAPSAGGIILLQNLIISVCVGACTADIEDAFELDAVHSPVLDVIIKLLPYFSGPVLTFQFSGYRFAICAYLELLLMVLAVCGYKRKKISGLGPCRIIIYVLLCIFVMAWSMGYYNRSLADDMNPAAAVIRAADTEDETDAALLDDISRVIDTQIISIYSDTSGEGLTYYYEVIHRSYTHEDMKACRAALLKLTLRHPGAYLKERFADFAKASADGMIWNLSIPLAIIFVFTIWNAYRRRWYLFIPSCTVIIQAAAVFFMEKSGRTMNFLFCYPAGYLILVYMVLYGLKKHRTGGRKRDERRTEI